MRSGPSGRFDYSDHIQRRTHTYTSATFDVMRASPNYSRTLGSYHKGQYQHYVQVKPSGCKSSREEKQTVSLFPSFESNAVDECKDVTGTSTENQRCYAHCNQTANLHAMQESTDEDLI